MSIFKSHAVIIKITKIEQNIYLYNIFSEAYGIIQCNITRGKKEKSLDVGYYIDCEISVKHGRDIHSIHNIKILSEMNANLLDFQTLYCFLDLLSVIQNKLPKGLPQEEVFSSLQQVITFSKNYEKQISEEKIVYIKIKILQLLGELGNTHKDPTINKILNFIYTNKAKDIIKLQGLNGKSLINLKDFSKTK